MNPYISHLSPVVGNSLGGLPRRASTVHYVQTPSNEPFWGVFAAASSNGSGGNVENFVIALDKDRFIVQYSQSSVVYSKIWSFSGRSATGYGQAVDQGAINNLCLLAPSTVLKVYQDYATGYFRCRLYSVPNTAFISLASAAIDFSTGVDFFGITRLTDNKALLVYRTTGIALFSARVLNISGSTITVGARYSLTGVDSYESDVIALTESRALAVYRNSTTGRYNAIVLDISGDVITFGSPVEYSSLITAGYRAPLSLAKVSDTQVACTVQKSDTGYCGIISIVDMVPTWNTLVSIAYSKYQKGVVYAGNSTLIVSCIGSTNQPLLNSYTISGNSLTLDNTVELSLSYAFRHYVAKLSDSVFVSVSPVNGILPFRFV